MVCKFWIAFRSTPKSNCMTDSGASMTALCTATGVGLPMLKEKTKGSYSKNTINFWFCHNLTDSFIVCLYTHQYMQALQGTEDKFITFRALDYWTIISNSSIERNHLNNLTDIHVLYYKTENGQYYCSNEFDIEAACSWSRWCNCVGCYLLLSSLKSMDFKFNFCNSGNHV